MDLNSEKLEVIGCNESVLVTANPGTGKTLLLAAKFADLVEKGVSPRDILCLTFTNKARNEMEKRIFKELGEKGIEINLSELNIFTFHSFALNELNETTIVSPNLLRYSIFSYLKEKNVFGYADEYLLAGIVPKTENLIRYLKSFGVLPEQIEIEKAKSLLEESNTLSKQEMETFLEEFVKIFDFYEKTKKGKGMDYADLLIDFLKLKKVKQFECVLVDELQDVNVLEAEIALRCSKKFLAVGDQKQAIFGFQGGSILNFKKFEKSKQFVLSDNYRSTDEILNYAREFFSNKTTEKSYKNALKGLKSALGKTGPKPVIINANENIACEAVALAQKAMEKGSVAVIARTNKQVMELAKEFSARSINHSSTHFSASIEAKNAIIDFLQGIFSSRPEFVKNAMFSPFYPISLQKAFELNSEKNLSLNEILIACPEFKELRERVSGLEDIHLLFKERILPVAVAFGEEYVFAALSLQEACAEALRVLEDKSLDSFIAFLKTADLLAQETVSEKGVVLTTIHKAKGRQFDYVIFIPKKTSGKTSFQDLAVEAILNSQGINAKEELEEEGLRSDFVALTRAEKELTVLTENPSYYLNDFAVSGKPAGETPAEMAFNEKQKKAYCLFVNKEFEKARELLEEKKPWLKECVENHFQGLDRVSFSSVSSNAFDYFISRILRADKPSVAKDIGSKVHFIAEKIVLGEEVEIEKELEPFADNVKLLLEEIKKNYPMQAEAECLFRVPLKKVIETNESIDFTGKIDAVFKNNEEYLIVDWKTDRFEDKASKHRQQLEAYKRSFSAMNNIPMEKIRVAIGFVGLKKRINDGKTKARLDDKQPAKTAFNTFSNKLNKLLEWKNNPETFLEEILTENKPDNALWQAIAEEILKEKNSNT